MSRATDTLEEAGLEPAEAKATAVTEATEGPASVEDRKCVGYLNTTHPDTGLDVVFVPGESLPDWALAVQRDRLAPPPADPGPSARKGVKAQRDQA